MNPFLEVVDLNVYFSLQKSFWLGKSTKVLHAVKNVSFKLEKGKTLGLVGESGSGKTTVGKTIIKLAPLHSGQIFFDGTEISSMTKSAFFPYRKKIQMIFQDPYNSLNPRLTIFQSVSEPLEIHFPKMHASDRLEKVAALLEKVGLKSNYLHKYPHELSGGQRQRVGIARALAVEPELIICDEPVSALDVSIQAQIVNLLQDLQDELGLSYLFIAHDLAVVEHISNNVIVMSSGEIVESASVDQIYHNPKHPYTQTLLNAVPKI